MLKGIIPAILLTVALGLGGCGNATNDIGGLRDNTLVDDARYNTYQTRVYDTTTDGIDYYTGRDNRYRWNSVRNGYWDYFARNGGIDPSNLGTAPVPTVVAN